MTKKQHTITAFLATTTVLLLPVVTFAQVSQPVTGSNNSVDAPVAAPAVSQEPVTATPRESSNYLLDTGDTVTISVDRHPDVSRVVPLQSDALVLLPRMERPINARGMNCMDLAEAIRKSLSNPRTFVLKPGQVTVSLAAMRVRRVFVRGNVVRGMDLDLKNGWRVTEMVAVMGGVPQPDRVQVTLTNPKRPALVKIDLAAALADENSVANLPLMEGDTLVFEGPRTKYLYVKGEGPRGKQELDERFTLKQALISLGVSQNNATGELRKAKLYRHTVPGDPTSPTTEESVDLVEILTKENVDHDLKDYDTLYIPLSLRYYYVWGELGGQRKRYLPEDRKTYLLDVMSDSGMTTPGQAKIGDVTIIRGVDEDKQEILHYDYGKFLKTGDAKYNPEIHPQDVVFVPNVKRVDPISSVWTGFGLYNIMKSFVKGLP